jgi:hypothetical protein
METNGPAKRSRLDGSGFLYRAICEFRGVLGIDHGMVNERAR